MKLVKIPSLCIFIFLSYFLIWPSLAQNDKIPAIVRIDTPPVLLNVSNNNSQSLLNKFTTQLNEINKNLQTLNGTQNHEAFRSLLVKAQDVYSETSKILTILKPRLTGYDQALKLINNVSEDKTQVQNDNFTKYRENLIKNRNDINTKVQQATILQLEANSQIAQIQQSLSNIQQVQLFSHSPSPLTFQFWQQLSYHFPNDLHKINNIYKDFIRLFTNAWNGGFLDRLSIFIGIASAILIIFVLQPLLMRSLVPVIEKLTPPTRLRRSLKTLFTAIIFSLAAGLSATLILTCVNYQDNVNSPAYYFSQTIIHQLYFCGFILGLYRGFLAVKKPQWRLLPISDQGAQAISLLPNLYALMIFLLGIVKYINTASNISSIGQQLSNGLFTCLASLLFIAIPIRLRKIGHEHLNRSTKKNLDIRFIAIAIGLPIFSVTSIIAILIGYNHLGYSMCVWLNWVILVCSALSLFKILLNDITSLMLDPHRWLGKKLQILGVRPQSMEQLSTVVNGFISLLTIVLILASVVSPGNFDLLDFIDNLTHTLTTQKIGSFTLSFSTIFQALLVLVIGLYCIKVVRKWLNEKLFPKTSLDSATQNSIDTIFNYCCWVGVAIIFLSILGVTTQNITWIISALSVGIGFGLQAIVQNFVSGLILLAERPVRIGDVVTIGGSKGTIMSIKVRATEIQLPDLSTLIVPNSQLITSSVQNSTRSRNLGVVSAKLPIISIKHLNASRELILNIMKKHPEVVDSPEPKVLVDSITETALMISITCYVNQSSNVDIVRSEIFSQYLNSINELASNGYKLDDSHTTD
ncbi:hypothetical protein COMNV_01318 [Commensalibacter sp. Nvir]|uniref:DUF3772 domain-containing protein n=1 Tax=Commensalibacter sp. Nvir TaxID=3069817 RepID=UPI002D59F94B|nr:hypothetical protein COMNV_01318 [Commensalibacter sp. Nvir]